jgi:hypothetical protein
MKPGLVRVLVSTFFLSICLATGAAESSDRASAQLGMEELASRLNLSSDQQAKIAPALQERNSRLEALVKERDASRNRRDKIKALREARSIQQAFVGKVTPVLTAQQKSQWDKLREEMRAELKEKRSSRN